MIVVVAEKPSVARDLAAHLHARSRMDGFLQGNGYQVTWALGHLVGLKEPGEYDVSLKKWTVDSLPILPSKFQLKQRGDAQAAKQLSVVRKLLRNADEIICATDAGREGELIFRYIVALAGCESKPARRLWLNSLTPQAIRAAFQSMRPLSDYDDLYAAAKCRSEADWIVGMNATRFHTLTHGSTDLLFSIGRVQTPVLAMIVKRDDQIRTFKPQPFWELMTTYREVTFRYAGDRFDTQAAADALLARVVGQELVVKKVARKPEQSLPPQLYDLTELQRDANRRFGLSAANTLQIAQTLYERKLISYPRTDSRYLSNDLKKEVPGILGALQERKPAEVGKLDLNALKFTGRIVNDQKVADHHAIIPTGTAPSGLSAVQMKVYDAIVMRLIAAFYPPCLKEVTTVDAESNGVLFRTRGVRVASPGWTELFPRRDVESGRSGGYRGATLPEFLEGELGSHDPFVKAGETVAPKHFTENTLLGAMETAGKLVDEEALREALREKGLGTPATRAAMIETLLQRKYIVRDGKNLHATDLGRFLVAKLRNPSLKSPELTGEWEAKLKRIEAGTASADEFMREVHDFAHAVVANEGPGSEDASFGTCPQCRQPVIRGKRGFGCSAWRAGCKFVLWPTHEGRELNDGQVRELLHHGAIEETFADDGGRQYLLALTDSGALVEVPVPAGDEQKSWTTIDLQSFAGSTGGATKRSKGAKRGKRLRSSSGELGPCPLCKSPVVEQEKSFSCSAWKSGCKFVVWKRMSGKRISKRTAKSLVVHGETSVLKGFKSRAGKSFDAKLKVTEDGRVEFEF